MLSKRKRFAYPRCNIWTPFSSWSPTSCKSSSAAPPPNSDRLAFYPQNMHTLIKTHWLELCISSLMVKTVSIKQIAKIPETPHAPPKIKVIIFPMVKTAYHKQALTCNFWPLRIMDLFFSTLILDNLPKIKLVSFTHRYQSLIAALTLTDIRTQPPTINTDMVWCVIWLISVAFFLFFFSCVSFSGIWQNYNLNLD